MDDDLVASLLAAVEAAPDDLVLRLHVARVLLDGGRAQEAVPHVASALAAQPDNAEALALMARVLSGPSQPAAPEPSDASGFDWEQADAQLSDIAEPMFVEGRPLGGELDLAPDVTRPSLLLSDVGGMQDVKERIEISFLLPMRNPQLRATYGKSLRGGLLLYGPPGCGKTYIARAVAGELGASFLSVALSDVLDMWVGSSERNIHEMFRTAREMAPCVLFLDEVDALGLKRSQSRNSGARNSVNQLLHELDGVEDNNEGVFVLAATNHPWDVDEALRRPGRLDRMIAVLPPDLEAREAIFRQHLRDRPIEGIDLGALARKSDGLTGADIALICESAAERAMVDSAKSGTVRLISMVDVLAALKETTPSAGPWLETARTVIEFADKSGQYAELKAYLKSRRML